MIMRRMESFAFEQETLCPCSGRRNMDLSNPTTLILIVIVLLVLGALLYMAFTRVQRSRRLQDRFGPEYERIVQDAGDKRKAEAELESRLAHVESLNIRQ